VRASAYVIPAQAEAAIANFTRCFKQQAASSDPSQVPQGCQTPSTAPPAVTEAFKTAAQQALGRDFVTSVERILFFNVGFWALTGLLSMLLPRVRPQPVARAQAA